MQEWLVGIVGSDLAPLVSVLLSALLVVALAVVAISAMRRFMRGGMGFSSAPGPRVEVVDVTAIDPKRKLVLVRRDQVEHLLLIGGGNDVVIESRIGRPAAPPARQPAAPEPAAESFARPNRAPEPAMTPLAPVARAPQAPEAPRPAAPAIVSPVAAPAVEAPQRRRDEAAHAPLPAVEPARRQNGRVEPGFGPGPRPEPSLGGEREAPAPAVRSPAPRIEPDRAPEPRIEAPRAEPRIEPRNAQPAPAFEARSPTGGHGKAAEGPRDLAPDAPTPVAARTAPAFPPRSLATPVAEPASRPEPAPPVRDGGPSRPSGAFGFPASPVAGPTVPVPRAERAAPPVFSEPRGTSEPVRGPEPKLDEPPRAEERAPLTVRSFASVIGARQNPTPPAPPPAPAPAVVPAPAPAPAVVPAPAAAPAPVKPTVPAPAAATAPAAAAATSSPATSAGSPFDDEDDDLARLLSQELAEDDDELGASDRDDTGVRADEPFVPAVETQRPAGPAGPAADGGAKELSIEEEMERLMRDFAARTNDRS